jgi:hypothetical protein
MAPYRRSSELPRVIRADVRKDGGPVYDSGVARAFRAFDAIPICHLSLLVFSLPTWPTCLSVLRFRP